MDLIKENLSSILEKINITSSRVGRSSQGIQLIAVSKKQSSEKILAYIKAAKILGLKNIILAENYLQEFLTKKIDLEKDLDFRSDFEQVIKFNYIGVVQSNKLNKILENFSVVQSISSLKQIEQVIKYVAVPPLFPKEIFLQVKLAKDDAKSGLSPKEVKEILPKIISTKGLKINGLMTIPREAAKEVEIRQVFRDLNTFRDELLFDALKLGGKTLSKANFLLSMGMSSDYKIAIEEGADIIRLGSAIFGERV